MQNPLNVWTRHKLLRVVFNWITGLATLARHYDEWIEFVAESGPQKHTARQFLDFMLNRLGIGVRVVDGGSLSSVPTQGPLIVVSNHPLGGLDGVSLSRLLLKARPDLKVLVNEQLMRFSEFSDLFVGVNVLSKGKQKANRKGLLALNRHLAEGGAALIFPAGTVSVLKNLRERRIQDAKWSEMVGRLALKYRAPCLPIFVEGRNLMSFYVAGIFSKRLRTMLLARAMLSKRNDTISLRIGSIVSSDEIQHIAEPAAVTQYLRLCSDILGGLLPENKTQAARVQLVVPLRSDPEKAELMAAIDALAPYKSLVSGPFDVYCAPYAAMGCVMAHLAISREKTFRAVDEGTGKDLDSDRFDPFYWHLWVWNRERGQVVGGYRLAKTDEVVKRHGLQSLYSRSLFDYEPSFLTSLGPAVEVGRSFIIPEYQSHPKVLDLLWKGIGDFMVKNAKYHSLFGCVSISPQYSMLARSLLRDTFLCHYGVARDVQRKVDPITPIRNVTASWDQALIARLSDVAAVNKILGRIDPERRVPILIRHYLNLNGKFISFSVNTDFNNALDGLILVDLRQAPKRYLDRYLGKDGAETFRDYWEMASHAA